MGELPKACLPKDSDEKMFCFRGGDFNEPLYCRVPESKPRYFVYRHEKQKWEEVLTPKHLELIHELLFSMSYSFWDHMDGWDELDLSQI